MNEKRKIVLVGCGFVGMSMAYSFLNTGGIDELVLIDVDQEKAIGEAMDLQHGLPYARGKMSIKAGGYEECRDAAVVVITAGVTQKPTETRLDLTARDTVIMKSVTEQIMASGFDGILVIASNPVDAMTYVAQKVSGLPTERVIGSGTILDTARLRCGLSEHFKVAQKNIHAYVFGEHGDTSFIPWTGAYISGVSLDEYYELAKNLGKDVEELDKDEMLTYVQKSGGKVIANKGATFYAVSAAVCKLCGILLASSDSIATVSSMMHGEYGIEDVCVSTLTLVGPNGIQGKVPMRMNKEEIAKLQASANALKEVIKQIEL